MDGGLRSACAIAGAAAALLGAAQPAAGQGLEAGVGRADITPPTGYIMLGWARGDARALGQHTRLFARALVLERGQRRLALVAADLNMVAGGMVVQAALAALEHQRAREQPGVLAERAGVAAGPAEHRVAGRRGDVGAAGAGPQPVRRGRLCRESGGHC